MYLAILVKLWLGHIIGINPRTTTTTNKEQIENLENVTRGLQDSMSRMQISVANKLCHIEETINKLSEVLLTTKAGSSETINNNDQFNSKKKDHHECMECSR